MSQGNATAAPLRPTDLRSLRDAVLDTAGTVGIAGAGTAAGWAGRLAPVDAVLDTTGLAGVITHNPADMTVAVRAGTRLRDLQDELAPHGQHVAFDAARVTDGATVGGLIATADAGPAALVHGSLRDLVIGVTFVLADGTVARSGGHVIKNVAGYDLAKLLHGSYGTLGVLAEVVLRLHPRPERTATLVIPCSLEEAAAHTATALGGPHEPTAIEWTSDGVLLVRIEGTAGALDARLERLRAALGAGEVADADPWERHAELVRGEPDLATLRIGVRPSRLPGVLADLPTRTVTAGLGTGVATVTLPPDAVAAAHARVHAAGGVSVLRSRPEGATAPAWGPPPSALPVLRAVKAELDPQGRFGPGRFDPWM
ncbi:MAG TPA: FAD-binding protein [Pseudonocardia sp.]|jgi:glycolate oxidase FAD binding subunit|uniref:FAD-binding oxidoreductase n=1 Tax=Pseudonocardia sp. TaxID=60912 RepID=UPI002B4B2D63|nr:FAD-binding protein [Pseudonocardia sp.]HLU58577.1 FAD-binding protein [Pseudonocardia sp.]